MADIDEPTGPANPTPLTGTADSGDKELASTASHHAPIAAASMAPSPAAETGVHGEDARSGPVGEPAGFVAAEADHAHVVDRVVLKPADNSDDAVRASVSASRPIDVRGEHAGSGPAGEAVEPTAAEVDPLRTADDAVTKPAESSDESPGASVEAPAADARVAHAPSGPAGDRPGKSGSVEAGRVDVAEAAVAKPVVAPATRVRPATIDARSLVFDPVWYWAQYADVAVAQLDAVAHYLDNGSAEGRDPNPYFSTRYYCEANPDVVSSGMNPFLHYILYGAREGRAPRG